MFADEGYPNVTVSKIAKECNMSRTGLYYYFNSKDEIYLKTIEYLLNAVMTDILEYSSKEGLTTREKADALDKYWTEEYDIKRVFVLFMELLILINRNTSEIFVKTAKRLKEFNEALVAFVDDNLPISKEVEADEVLDTYVVIELVRVVCDTVNHLNTHFEAKFE